MRPNKATNRCCRLSLQGTRRLRLHWFYSIHDDEVRLLLSGKDRNSAKDLAGYDPHRLWRARERDARAYQVPLSLKWCLLAMGCGGRGRGTRGNATARLEGVPAAKGCGGRRRGT